MKSEIKRDLIFAAVVFFGGAVLCAGAGAYLYYNSAPTQAATTGDDILNAIDSAPIDSAPIDGAVPPGDQANLIPQESLDLLGKIDSGGDGADLFNFEKTHDGKYHKVSFKALGGFPYDVPDPEVVRAQADPTKPPTQQIPEALQKLDGAPALLAGFMVPIDIDADGNVKSFALTQDQMYCCYGVPPKMNQWVLVQMGEGLSVPYKNNVPVAAFGTLDVGEEFEDGYVLNLYRMTAEKVVDVKELVGAQ